MERKTLMLLLGVLLSIRQARPSPIPCHTSDVSISSTSSSPITESGGNSSPLTSPSSRETRDVTSEGESTPATSTAINMGPLTFTLESTSSAYPSSTGMTTSAYPSSTGMTTSAYPSSTGMTTTIATANKYRAKRDDSGDDDNGDDDDDDDDDDNDRRKRSDETDESDDDRRKRSDETDESDDDRRKRSDETDESDDDRRKRSDETDESDDDRRKRSDETDESDDDRRKRSDETDESDDDRRKRSDETDESDDDRRKRRDDSDDNSDDSDDSDRVNKRDDDSDDDDDDDDDSDDSDSKRRNNNRDSESKKEEKDSNSDKLNSNDKKGSEKISKNENSDRETDTRRRKRRQADDEDSTDTDIDDGDDVDGVDGDDDDDDEYDSYYRKKRGTYYYDGELHNDGSFVKSLTFRRRRDADQSGEIENYFGYPQFRRRREPVAETNPTVVPWKDSNNGPDHSEDDGDSEEAPDDIPYKRRRRAPPSTDLEPPKEENDESYSILHNPVTVRKQSVSLESVPDPARPVTGSIPSLPPNHQETYNNLKKTLQAFEELALLTFFGVHFQPDQPYGNDDSSDGTPSSEGNVPAIAAENTETSTSVSSTANMSTYKTEAAKEAESTTGSINDLVTKPFTGEQEYTTHIYQTTGDDEQKTNGMSAEMSSVPEGVYISTTDSESYTTESAEEQEKRRLQYVAQYPLDLFMA